MYPKTPPFSLVLVSFSSYFYCNHHWRSEKPAAARTAGAKELLIRIYTNYMSPDKFPKLLPRQACSLFLPSMASFFFWQVAQRKGPSNGSEAVEKKGPEFANSLSQGGWSTWQTAHLKTPEFWFRGKFFPNLRRSWQKITAIDWNRIPIFNINIIKIISSLSPDVRSRQIVQNLVEYNWD